ncbi:MAG: hypothetical protein HRU26_02350 [Psychroserpens sp.]|nr:hypothetical protein [Psychroserpens sp.]
MNDLLIALLTIIPTLEADPNGNPAENALGPYHIRPIMVQEVNRIMKIQKLEARYTHQDAHDERLAKHMVVVHMRYWGKQYEKRTGMKATIDILARIHNGGAFGPYKFKTFGYGQRAKNLYEDRQALLEKVESHVNDL